MEKTNKEFIEAKNNLVNQLRVWLELVEQLNREIQADIEAGRREREPTLGEISEELEKDRR